MVKRIDLRNVSDKEKCKDAKEVASKVGIQIICDDDDATENFGQKKTSVLYVPDYEDCDKKSEVASRFGVQVVCDDDK